MRKLISPLCFALCFQLVTGQAFAFFEKLPASWEGRRTDLIAKIKAARDNINYLDKAGPSCSDYYQSNYCPKTIPPAPQAFAGKLRGLLDKFQKDLESIAPDAKIADAPIPKADVNESDACTGSTAALAKDSKRRKAAVEKMQPIFEKIRASLFAEHLNLFQDGAKFQAKFQSCLAEMGSLKKTAYEWNKKLTGSKDPTSAHDALTKLYTLDNKHPNCPKDGLPQYQKLVGQKGSRSSAQLTVIENNAGTYATDLFGSMTNLTAQVDALKGTNCASLAKADSKDAKKPAKADDKTAKADDKTGKKEPDAKVADAQNARNEDSAQPADATEKKPADQAAAEKTDFDGKVRDGAKIPTPTLHRDTNDAWNTTDNVTPANDTNTADTVDNSDTNNNGANDGVDNSNANNDVQNSQFPPVPEDTGLANNLTPQDDAPKTGITGKQVLIGAAVLGAGGTAAYFLLKGNKSSGGDGGGGGAMINRKPSSNNGGSKTRTVTSVATSSGTSTATNTSTSTSSSTSSGTGTNTSTNTSTSTSSDTATASYSSTVTETYTSTVNTTVTYTAIQN